MPPVGEDVPGSDRLDMRITAKMGGAPAILNTCIAYGTDSPVVQRRWPHLYTGSQAQVPPSDLSRGGVTRVLPGHRAVEQPMVGGLVPRFARRRTEILHHEHPHRAGAAAAWPMASIWRTRRLMSWRSRRQISASASHSSGSSRMLVRPRSATTLRLISRLPDTAAPCSVQPDCNTSVLRNGLRAAQIGNGAAFSRSMENRLVTLRSGTAAISRR